MLKTTLVSAALTVLAAIAPANAFELTSADFQAGWSHRDQKRL